VAKYRVQVDANEVKDFEEHKLRKKLRSSDLSGLELVRVPGEERWQPLYELPLFREEVPGEGDPREIAHQRVARGFAWHLIAFIAVIGAFTVASGSVPFWAAFWGIGLFFHGAKAAPSVATLLKEKGAQPAGLVSALDSAKQRARDDLDEEAEHIRRLLAEREGELAASLSDEVDELVAQVRELIAQEADLDDQTSEEERASIERELESARSRLAEAEGADRALFGKQVETLQARLDAMDDADRAKVRLLARKSVAINQLKQLRLDLTKAKAGQSELGDLNERLADMRIEVEAAREVEETVRSPQLPPMPSSPADAVEEQRLEEEEEVVTR
jgi:ElaB/YqjD/DUF883 family membrane-anchored ribosome-binding protein